MAQDYMDRREEGPASLYPERPEPTEFAEASEQDEDGFDVGDITNGWVVYDLFAGPTMAPVLIGPFRSEQEAQREARDRQANADPIAVGGIVVTPLLRPFAAVGVQLLATEGEVARYDAAMQKAPQDRSIAEEALLEQVGDILFNQSTVEGTDGYDRP
jgi:hypothetical protein